MLKCNVSLYSITKDVAFFVETPDGIDIYSSDFRPFLYMTQFQQYQSVITMPIQSFHKLAEEIYDPSCQVILLSNTGWCGSSIVGQIIEYVKVTLLMLEPGGLNLALMIEAGELLKDDHNKWLSSVIKITCKPHDLNTTRICIKPRFCAMFFLWNPYLDCFQR